MRMMIKLCRFNKGILILWTIWFIFVKGRIQSLKILLLFLFNCFDVFLLVIIRLTGSLNQVSQFIKYFYRIVRNSPISVFGDSQNLSKEFDSFGKLGFDVLLFSFQLSRSFVAQKLKGNFRDGCEILCTLN